MLLRFNQFDSYWGLFDAKVTKYSEFKGFDSY